MNIQFTGTAGDPTLKLMKDTTMPSNERKMTLEEKLVQNIKSDTIMALVGDEDALLELTKRAINEALYQPIRTKDSYGRINEAKDSPVVAAARSIANTACQSIANDMIAEMMQSEAVKDKVQEMIAATMPVVIRDWLEAGLSSKLEQSISEAKVTLIDAMKSGDY
jgi:hypothetical protein